jgi:hypothetical protein
MPHFFFALSRALLLTRMLLKLDPHNPGDSHPCVPGNMGATQQTWPFLLS